MSTRPTSQFSFSRNNSSHRQNPNAAVRIPSLSLPPSTDPTLQSPLTSSSLFTISPVSNTQERSLFFGAGAGTGTVRDSESSVSSTMYSSLSPSETLMPPPLLPSQPPPQAPGSTISRTASNYSHNILSRSQRATVVFGSPRLLHPTSSQPNSSSSSSAAVLGSSRFSSYQPKSYYPRYLSPEVQDMLARPAKDRLAHYKKVISTPETSVRSGKTSSGSQDKWEDVGIRAGSASSAHSGGNGGGSGRGGDVSQRCMDGSKGKEKSQSSAPVVGSQEYAPIDTKTSSQDTAIGRLSQTVDNRAQWVMQRQQQSSPSVAIENAGKEVVARLEEKGDEPIKLLAAEAEKATQRTEEEALQRWKDGLEVQLKATVDTMQALIRQAPDQKVLSLQAVQQIVAEQFQRNDEQSGPLAIEKAGERVITLLERKGDELVKSMTEKAGNVSQRIGESVGRGVEESVAQMMEEICQGWKKILADHKETATETSRGLTQCEQGPSSLQGIDEWRAQFDTRITSEIKTIKDMAAAQSQTLNTIKDAAKEQSQILNAIMQQIQKGYQEHRTKALRSPHPMFNDGDGSNSGDRLSPVNLRSFCSPQTGFQGGQDSTSSQHAVAHSVFHPSVAPRGRQADTTAQPDTMCRNESHEAGTQIAHHQTSAPTAASFSNNVVTPIQAVASSTTTSTTATITTKTKLEHKRKVVTGPTSNTAGTEAQALMSAEGSASRALSELPRGKQVKHPTAITSGAKQRTLVSTGISAAHALSTIAKGKQVSRREPPPPQATDSTANSLQDHAGLLGSSSVMTPSAWTSITDSSALSSPSSSVLSSASSQNASKLVRMDASGGYIVIQGLNDAPSVPMVSKLPRGRLRKNSDNKSVLSQGPSTSIVNKRRKVAPNLALRPVLEFSPAPTLARTSAPSRRALSEHSYAQRANVIATLQDSDVKIKAEDIVVLTPRLTRASRMKLLPSSNFLDLDSVKKQVEEAGGAWRY